MSLPELQNQIVQKIFHIKDDAFLRAIIVLLDTKLAAGQHIVEVPDFLTHFQTQNPTTEIDVFNDLENMFHPK